MQAAEALAYARSWHDSVIDDAFGGVLQSTLQCMACKKQSHNFEPFLDLCIPIVAAGSKDKSVTLQVGGKSRAVQDRGARTRA